MRRMRFVALVCAAAAILGACTSLEGASSGTPATPTRVFVANVATDEPRQPIPTPASPANPPPPQEGAKLQAPAAGMYLAANADFGGQEDQVTVQRIAAFTQASGRGIAWAYFSDNWMNGIAFPAAQVAAARAAGTTPFIRMMPRATFDQDRADPVYTLQKIIDGQYDAQLTQWARAAKAAGPLLIEFGTEVNGDWFPWNGKYNGGPGAGPQRFRDAYRHVVDLFRREGAANITWFFHVDASGSPSAAWNAMANYYPGDGYVDWLGISAYGAQSPVEDWVTFSSVFDAGYRELAAVAPTKPIALLEFAVTDGYPGHDKAQWIRDAFATIRSGRYPRLKAASWWNETFQNDDGTTSSLRIDSSQAALDAYRTAIADPWWVTTSAIN